MHYISFLLRVILGLLFIYSGYTKFITLSIFEINLVDFGLSNWTFAPILARIFIGLEYILGVYLILGWNLKKQTIPISLALLVLFTGALGYMIWSGQLDKSCGCFGTAHPMSPIQGIYKNIVLAIVLVIIYRFDQIFHFSLDKFNQAIYWVILVFISNLLFFTQPMKANLDYLDAKKVNYRPPLELLYSAKQSDTPQVNLREGKWIMAFLSLTCKHCKVAAEKLASYKKSNSELPIYFILNGDIKLKDSFLLKYKATEIPHNMFIGTEDVTRLAGNSAPIIFWMNHGIVEKKTNQDNSNLSEMVDWYHEK